MKKKGFCRGYLHCGEGSNLSRLLDIHPRVEQDAKSFSSVETHLEREFRVAENTFFSRGGAVCRRIDVLCYHRMCVYAKGYLAQKAFDLLTGKLINQIRDVVLDRRRSKC